MAKQSAQASPAKPPKPPKPPKSTDNLDAFSIVEFCRRHAISRGTYYNIKRLGQGPRETKIRKRIVITAASAAAWLRQQEKQSA